MNSIILFIIVFGILVFVHEFGHYFFAKKLGVLVIEFSIGMGPVIFSYNKNGTAYTLRLLPLGGYVRLAGVDETEIPTGSFVNIKINDNNVVENIFLKESSNHINAIPFTVVKADLQDKMVIEGYESGNDQDLISYNVVKDAFITEENGTLIRVAPLETQIQNQKPWKKLLVNFAGPFNNIVLAILAFITIGFLNGGVPVDGSGVVINDVAKNSVAQKSGLKKSDEIISYNQKPIKKIADLPEAIEKNNKQQNLVVVLRNDKHKEINVPKLKKKQTLGITMQVKETSKNPLSIIKYGFNQVWLLTKQIFTILGTIFTGKFSLNQLSGPVGIYAAVDQVSKTNSFTVAISLLGSLSLSLAIMNMLPIPALDGGKIVLNLYEIITRRKVSAKFEMIITIIGAIFLILLMILVTANDIFKNFIH